MTQPARRGRPASTSREEILDAAAAFGADELTMSKLAMSIGMSKAALYRYFDSREVLLDALAERVLEQANFDGIDRSSWDRFLVTTGLALYDLFDGTPVLIGQESTGLRVFGVRLLEDTLAQMEPAGFDAATTFRAASHLGALVTFAASQTTYLAAGPLTADQVNRTVAESAGSTDVTHLLAVTDLLASFDPREALRANLEVLVAGLAALRD